MIDHHGNQLSFLPTNIQLRVRKAMIQAEDMPIPYQRLEDSVMPHPLSMTSLMPCKTWLDILTFSPGGIVGKIRNLGIKCLVSVTFFNFQGIFEKISDFLTHSGHQEE